MLSAEWDSHGPPELILRLICNGPFAQPGGLRQLRSQLAAVSKFEIGPGVDQEMNRTGGRKNLGIFVVGLG